MNDQIEGVSRSGDFVVIERGMARYPPICIWCGDAPPEELTPVTLIYMRSRRSYEQIKEGLPVCKNCHAKSKGRAKAAMSVGAALFAVGVTMMIILSNGGFTPDSPVAISLGIGSGVTLMLGIAALVVAFMFWTWAKQRSVALINDREIWIRDVNIGFLMSLPEWNGPKRF
jgi:hypothetical protein